MRAIYVSVALAITLGGCLFVFSGCTTPPVASVADLSPYTEDHVSAIVGVAFSNGPAMAINNVNRYFASTPEMYKTNHFQMDEMLKTSQRLSNYKQNSAVELATKVIATWSGSLGPNSNSSASPTQAKGDSGGSEGQASKAAGTTPSGLPNSNSTCKPVSGTAAVTNSDEGLVADSPFDELDRVSDFYGAYMLKAFRFFSDSRTDDAASILQRYDRTDVNICWPTTRFRRVYLYLQTQVHAGTRPDTMVGVRVRIISPDVKILRLHPTRSYDLDMVACDDSVNVQATFEAQGTAPVKAAKVDVAVKRSAGVDARESRKFLTRVGKMSSYADASNQTFGWDFYPSNPYVRRVGIWEFVGRLLLGVPKVYKTTTYLEGGAHDCAVVLLIPATNEVVEADVSSFYARINPDAILPRRERTSSSPMGKLSIPLPDFNRDKSAAKDVEKVFRQQPYTGSADRKYTVHLPPGYNQSGQSLPLVMVLHGCCEDQKTIQHDSNFDAIADREGFIVVYPFITSYPPVPARDPNCWGFWIPEQTHRGAGEVEDLAGILREVQRDYRVNPNRIHIAGLSSGGGMAVAAMVGHSHLIASGSPTAGLPYSEAADAVSAPSKAGKFKPVGDIVSAMKAELGPGGRAVPIFIIHSKADRRVDIQSCDNIRDSWGQVFGVNTANPEEVRSGSTKGTPWTHKYYGVPGKPTLIETLAIEGLDHGWYGGRNGNFAFADAPNTAELIWRFFKTHPMDQAPTVTITSATADPAKQSLFINGTVSTDGSLSGVKVKVELLGRSPQPAIEAQVDVTNKTWAFSSGAGLLSNIYYRPRVTAIGAGGAVATVGGRPIALGNPEARRPKLTINYATADRNVILLRGTVKDDFGVQAVQVRVNGGQRTKAVIKGSDWSFQNRGLFLGTNVVEVRAVDKDTLETVQERVLTVAPP